MMLHKQRSIFRNGQRFFRALVSPDFIFFCDYREGDDNSNCLMFTKRGRLVSDNYFANVGLLDEIQAGKFRATRTMQNIINQMEKE